MNFTREPIIETVITPRDGCKLIVRSSKGAGQEEYSVDAVEVVSFGHSHFFRSQESPKSFLVPVSDYEILETKEARMVLKNVVSDKAIKISGGVRPQEMPRDEIYTESRPAPERPSQNHDPRDRKRGQRRRGRRGRDRHEPHPEMQASSESEEFHESPQQQNHEEPQVNREPFPQEGGEPPKAPSFISKLFPPPPTLIKESLSRYKPVETNETGVSFTDKTSEEPFFEHPESKDLENEDEE